MQGNSRQGFVLSVLLHLAVVTGAVLVTLVQPPEKPRVHVFTMVTPPPSDGVASAEPALEFNIPEPAARPAPRPPPVQQPPPRPPPRPVEQPAVRPAPRPAPAQPPQEQLSYEEFVRQHGAPQPRAPRPTQSRPVRVPRIDTSFAVKASDAVLNVDSMTLSGAEQSALDSYIGRLLAALRRAWDVPPGMSETLNAMVEVEVAANGRLSGARITKRSGNAQFDQSILDTFTTVGSAGPPPEGRSLRLRLPFRLTEG